MLYDAKYQLLLRILRQQGPFFLLVLAVRIYGGSFVLIIILTIGYVMINLIRLLSSIKAFVLRSA